MPFHSRPRLTIQILSEAGTPRFKESVSTIVSFSDKRVQEGELPGIRSIQRLPSGDEMEREHWGIREVTSKFATRIPGVRLFEVVFEGREFSVPFHKKRPDALRLYRSILAEEVVRLTVVLDGRLFALDVELSYQLHQVADEVPC